MDDPIALDAYERLANAYAARVDDKPHNAFYDRPAALDLLPPLAGLRVLDAGCGPGAYAERLVEAGAEVVGLDVSPRMIELARARLGGRATILRADLNRPLDMLGDGRFDLVVAPLVLDYLPDWLPVFREFRRVLRPGGRLVFSVGHPLEEFYARPDAVSYHEVERVEMVWRGFGEPIAMPSYRRPLSAMFGPLLAAGFALERLVEPRPTDAFRRHDPEGYEKLMRRPGFLCIRALADQPG